MPSLAKTIFGWFGNTTTTTTTNPALGNQMTTTSTNALVAPTVNTLTVQAVGGGGGGGASTHTGNIIWSTGGAGGGGANGYYTIGGTGITTIPHGVSVNVLSKEEEDELQELNRQHKEELKAAKLNGFKKLPAELRQFIVNFILIKEGTTEMQKATVDKSTRHQELELRKSLSNVTLQWSSSITSWIIDPIAILGLPDDVTTEDIKQAHLDATLEEQMLDSDE